MTKEKYIEELRKYCEERNLTYQEFFQETGKKIRMGKESTLPTFEQENPFLNIKDRIQLITCDDTQIIDYYAAIMEMVVREFQTVRNAKREEIKSVIDEQLEEVETLSKEDIKETINEEMDKALTKEDIREVVEENLNEPTIRVVMTGIGRNVANLLNGFAIIKEEKTGRVHMYYYDAETRTLKGEKNFSNKEVKSDSGYYVNYEEYIDKMLERITDEYPAPEEIRFVREDGEERSLKELLEEAFQILKRKGAIRFGRELAGKKVDTYEDLVRLNLSQMEEYASEKLRSGIYVRRDILTRIFTSYKAKITLVEERERKQFK